MVAVPISASLKAYRPYHLTHHRFAQQAEDPDLMAVAMRHAVEAGRAAFKAGRIPKRLYAEASTPEEGLPGLG